jgi:hypothetical protein
MEISNFSAIGNALAFLGHENTSVIIITAMPIILHPTMFVHEVIQYKETFQRIKWRLKLTGRKIRNFHANSKYFDDLINFS